MFFLKTLLFSCALWEISSLGDYYWRDWNGTAPTDGFIAGHIDGNPTYVAQAYVKDYGLYVGYVQDQQFNVSINTGLSNYVALNYSTVVKVLCTKELPFTWIKATTDTIDSILQYYLPLVAGKTNTEYNTIVYVGRYNGSVNTYIGSIHTDLWLYYSNATVGLDSSMYELLVRNL